MDRGRVNLYVPAEDQELWEKAKREAGRLGVSLSVLVAEALETWLKERERDG